MPTRRARSILVREMVVLTPRLTNTSQRSCLEPGCNSINVEGGEARCTTNVLREIWDLLVRSDTRNLQTRSKRSNIRRILSLSLALLVALALAAPVLAQGAGEAQVRVAHLSPDAPSVDVDVNGEPTLINVSYTTVSDYPPFPAGTQQALSTLRVTPRPRSSTRPWSWPPAALTL
jgi:hypothetical protein